MLKHKVKILPLKQFIILLVYQRNKLIIMENQSKVSYTAFAVILAIGLIIAALLISGTWRKVARGSVSISVTGSATKPIRSDLGVWNGTFSVDALTLKDAYSKLKSNYDIVNSYLLNKGFESGKIKFSAINTVTLYATNDKGYKTEQVTGYRLSQTVSVESQDVDKIDLLSREATELINQGIEIYSSPPEFFYTKLGDLKIEMIGLAAQDAKNRAEQIAKSTGNDVGEVRSSKTGVIQVNAKNSTEVSDYGVNDTSSLEKTITAVVTISFSID